MGKASARKKKRRESLPLIFDEVTSWSEEKFKNALGLLGRTGHTDRARRLIVERAKRSIGNPIINPKDILGVKREVPMTTTLFEDDPKWNGPERIDPSECFITSGPGEIEGQFYPVLMKRRVEGDFPSSLGGNDEYNIIAKMRMGFAEHIQAVHFAAKTMTAVPILVQDLFVYPYFVGPEEDEDVNS